MSHDPPGDPTEHEKGPFSREGTEIIRNPWFRDGRKVSALGSWRGHRGLATGRPGSREGAAQGLERDVGPKLRTSLRSGRDETERVAGPGEHPEPLAKSCGRQGVSEILCFRPWCCCGTRESARPLVAPFALFTGSHGAARPRSRPRVSGLVEEPCRRPPPLASRIRKAKGMREFTSSPPRSDLATAA